MKTTKLALSVSIIAASIVVAQTPPEMVIPNAPASTPGQCHALVHVPAKMGTVIEKVLIQPVAETLEVVPAKYEWIEKQVAITTEEKLFEVIPATYKTVKEKVLIEPERLEFELVPAKFKETNVKVLVRPAMRVWKRSKPGIALLSGEVMRLIEEDNIYKILTKKTMITPPQFKEIKIDAVYSEFDKKVINVPASVKEIIKPAEFKVVRVKKLVEDAKEIRTPTEEVYEDITKEGITKKAKMDWQRVPCEADLSKENIIAIQKGLQEAGYKVSIDGQFGSGTVKILEDFQEKNGLSKGAMTIETMQKLGVKIK